MLTEGLTFFFSYLNQVEQGGLFGLVGAVSSVARSAGAS